MGCLLCESQTVCPQRPSCLRTTTTGNPARTATVLEDALVEGSWKGEWLRSGIIVRSHGLQKWRDYYVRGATSLWMCQHLVYTVYGQHTHIHTHFPSHQHTIRPWLEDETCYYVKPYWVELKCKHRYLNYYNFFFYLHVGFQIFCKETLVPAGTTSMMVQCRQLHPLVSISPGGYAEVFHFL